MGAPKKFKSWMRPLFRPRTDHACPQKPNPSRETVPLNIKSMEIVSTIAPHPPNHNIMYMYEVYVSWKIEMHYVFLCPPPSKKHPPP